MLIIFGYMKLYILSCVEKNSMCVPVALHPGLFSAAAGVKISVLAC